MLMDGILQIVGIFAWKVKLKRQQGEPLGKAETKIYQNRNQKIIKIDYKEL